MGEIRDIARAPVELARPIYFQVEPKNLKDSGTPLISYPKRIVFHSLCASLKRQLSLPQPPN